MDWEISACVDFGVGLLSLGRGTCAALYNYKEMGGRVIRLSEWTGGVLGIGTIDLVED